MYKQNLELAERNKTLMLLRRIDELVLKSTTSAREVAQLITDLLIDEIIFNLAIIYIADKSKSFGTAHGLSVIRTTPEGRQLLKTHLSKASLHPPRSPKKGDIRLVSSFTTIKPELADSVNDKLKETLQVKTLFICRLRAGSGPIGLLVLGQPSGKNELSEYQKTLVERLTATISIAIENQLLYQELQEASAHLRAQNKKLKEMDQTKDEFISMASHQLRTPLTTVKGYLSMVLEGDVGPVTKKEKALLGRAFNGAQKMVYLIADMLNVSRLQTGKFVIENQPTNLPAVVKSEVAQLQENAQHRRQKLTFHKPDNFPTLSLDETKTRQVVMNFIDNAIYYTPNGGRIAVELQATDKEITYTVTDTGVGVPKSDQAHLFSKFYRADNVKKLRPDGTGLGLFMAKKVIVAQGGALIFKSVEGKGSTFGFSFPRAAKELKGPIKPEPPKTAELLAAESPPTKPAQEPVSANPTQFYH